ncbi:YafY family protein [Pelagibius sp. Alg239-R121]|uniref:helix-turn-helix transcriptional regulator n=1 Tax=Pelagibius sp. Alg239-R121 TaxID=2993448 RepID=UPI0024A722A6|nr:YafY family protein [Pelagibius sp. Alg239-R121]
MRPAERLFRIIQIMRATGRVMTAAEIAERLEVSARTVYRDLGHLMASGAPIDGERGIGYLLREAFDAPPLTFTFEQLEALAFGAKAVQALAGEDLGIAAREALAKIETSIPPEHARRLKTAPLFAVRGAKQPKPPKSLGSIRRAISERHRLRIDYRSLLDKRSERTIRPLGLTNFGAVWLLTAWCELRNDFRDFRVDRIEEFAVQRKRFKVEADKSFEAYLARFPDC